MHQLSTFCRSSFLFLLVNFCNINSVTSDCSSLDQYFGIKIFYSTNVLQATKDGVIVAEADGTFNILSKSSGYVWGLLVFRFRKSLKTPSELLMFRLLKSLKESSGFLVLRSRKSLKESWRFLMFRPRKCSKNLEGFWCFGFVKV